MKKLALGLVLAVLLLAIPATAFAQVENWDGNVHKGDFMAFAGVGFGGYGFSIVPGAEWVFADWKVGDVVPLAFGVSAKGAINFYSSWWTSFGVGAFLTGHLGLGGLDIPEFLQKFDFYANLGLGLSWFIYSGGWEPYGNFRIGFASSEGVAYYFTDKFAAYAEHNYWAYPNNGVIGMLFKF